MATQGASKNKRQARQSTRVPAGGQRQRLAIGDEYKDENYVYRWVNDEAGNIDRYRQGGYDFVESTESPVIGEDQQDHGQPVDSTVSMHVGRTRYSTNGTAYLMRIRREYYDEDQEEKRKDRLETKKAMFQADPDMGQFVREHKSDRS